MDLILLRKFETKTNRVKGLSFHPHRPWILVSLHNGVIQLYDYRMEILIDSFEEHEGPVRGIDFHATMPLFVSGGDDYKVKVWNYQMKRCLYTLNGHLDYIRTVQFHPGTHPWILSSSDDQTVRIWNWQSRNCLVVLTGHNHYVMCAQWHPSEDLILSASLDQTIRIWDISGLIKRSTSIVDSGHSFGGGPAGMHGHSGGPGGSSGGGGASGDMFGSVDAVVKFVLEGHTRGVNWASFHPSQNLVVSGADDKEIKVWRMSGSRAWETTTYRGHLNNVSCVLFDEANNVIISNSEDRTLRIFDVNRNSSPLVFRRESDRYWILAKHPRLNLLAAGHDSGMFVFKLQRERPAYDTSADSVFYYKNGYLRLYNTQTDKDIAVMQAGIDAASDGSSSSRKSKSSSNSRKPRRLFYNEYSTKSSQSALLFYDNTSASSAGNAAGDRSSLRSSLGGGAEQMYQILTFGSTSVSTKLSSGRSRSSDSGSEASNYASGMNLGALSVAWLSRNRFAVLDSSGNIELRNLDNESKKKIKLSELVHQKINYIFEGGAQNRLLLRSHERVFLFDSTTKKAMKEIQILRYPVKFVRWSMNRKKVAMLTRYSVIICDNGLADVNTIFENSKVKSGVWVSATDSSDSSSGRFAKARNDCGVFLYTTTTHLKYALANGDHGIVKTLSECLYIVSCKGNSVYCLNRKNEVVSIEIDHSEYLFKKALIERRYRQVKRLIDSGSLRGESIISYLQKKGFPEVALPFVSDPQTKFELAIECGNIVDAFNCAIEIDSKETWNRFAKSAILQGNYRHTTEAYKRVLNFDKLMYLFSLTGNTAMLQKLSVLAKEQLQNYNLQYVVACLTSNDAAKVDSLQSAKQEGLAYLTAAAADPSSDAAAQLRQKLVGDGDGKKTIKLPSWMKDDSKQDESGDVARQPDGFGLVSALRPVWGPHSDPQMYDWPRKDVKRGYFDQADMVDEDAVAAEDEEEAADAHKTDGISDRMLDESSDGAAADGGGEMDFGFGDEAENKGVSKKSSPSESAVVGWGASGDGDDFELSDESGDEAETADAMDFALAGGAADGSVFVMPRSGLTAREIWSSKSSCAADMIAAGKFDLAMEALNRQFGIVNFSNVALKAHFLNIYTSTHTQVQSYPGGSLNLRSPLSRGDQLPLISITLAQCEDKIKQGHSSVTGAQFAEAEGLFREALQMVSLAVISDSDELARARRVIDQSREYINAMRCKLQAMALASDSSSAAEESKDNGNELRRFELNCLFAEFDLEDSHKFSALYAAIKIGYTLKMFETIAVLCRRMLELGSSGRIESEAASKHMKQISKVLKKCESKGGNESEIEYDPRNFAGVCPMKFELISRSDQTVKGPLCGSDFLKKYDGLLSPTDELSRIGSTCVGLSIQH